ncbi:hypothetical protein [Aquaspirillum serpens]|nr:hypothetical protein [Aquaspirillum serpens]
MKTDSAVFHPESRFSQLWWQHVAQHPWTAAGLTLAMALVLLSPAP